ncbi:hypothetical protein ACF1AB_39645 [Streptomyces sp. NPDC014846]
MQPNDRQQISLFALLAAAIAGLASVIAPALIPVLAIAVAVYTALAD